MCYIVLHFYNKMRASTNLSVKSWIQSAQNLLVSCYPCYGPGHPTSLGHEDLLFVPDLPVDQDLLVVLDLLVDQHPSIPGCVGISRFATFEVAKRFSHLAPQ